MINRVKHVISATQRNLSRLAPTSSTRRSFTNVREGRPGELETDLEDTLRERAKAQIVLGQHEAFLKWYVGFLESELIPTASYQRHITALKAAVSILKLGKKAAGSSEVVDPSAVAWVLTSPTWIRLILDRIVDPFDDVRETAASLLMMIPPEAIHNTFYLGSNPSSLIRMLQEFCTRASELAAKTGRADYGDGAARSHGILCSWYSSIRLRLDLVFEVLDRLEAKISRAERDLGHAAIEDSLHGDFSALRYRIGASLDIMRPRH
jgi:hypothetical protein